jgi:hypothetical protein
MNHHGKIPDYDSLFDGDEPPEFRSAFPVRYLIVDFGFSSYASLGPNSGLLIEPLRTGRRHKAPESVRTKFDPYAADVYQAARFLYTWIHVAYLSLSGCSLFALLMCNPQEIVPQIPELLGLLQDMSYFNPRRRISMSAALSRLRGIHTRIQDHEMLYTPHELDGLTFPMIPMRHWSWLIDAIWLGQFSFAREYLFRFHLEL